MRSQWATPLGSLSWWDPGACWGLFRRRGLTEPGVPCAGPLWRDGQASTSDAEIIPRNLGRSDVAWFGFRCYSSDNFCCPLSFDISQQKNRGFDHGIWPKTAVFEVAATPLGHQRSHRPAVGMFLTFVKARAGVWSKFVPDLVATGHPCQFHLFGTFYIGTTSACTGPCLWISFAKLGGRESATRILEFKDRKRTSGLVKGKVLGLASFVRL